MSDKDSVFTKRSYEEMIEKAQMACYLAEAAQEKAKDAAEKAQEANDLAKAQRVELSHAITQSDELKNNDKAIFKRLSKVEWLTHNHEETITEIVEEQEEISESLSTIQETMNSIKWIMVGAFGFYFLNTVGFLETLKTFIQ